MFAGCHCCCIFFTGNALDSVITKRKSLTFFKLFLVEDFDLATHLNTVPELVDRTFNRPTIKTLETKSIMGAVDPERIKVCDKKNMSFFYYVQLTEILYYFLFMHLISAFIVLLKVSFSFLRNLLNRGKISTRCFHNVLTERRRCLSLLKRSRLGKIYK